MEVRDSELPGVSRNRYEDEFTKLHKISANKKLSTLAK